MAIHQSENHINFVKYEGQFHENFKELHQEVNYSYNYKPERPNIFLTACAVAASFPVLSSVF
jgi:hypothetical protein